MDVETIRVSAFMQRFGFGRTKTYELLNSGKLESIKVDGTRLIKMRSARALIGEAA
jgi:hypothetical protein